MPRLVKKRVFNAFYKVIQYIFAIVVDKLKKKNACGFKTFFLLFNIFNMRMLTKIISGNKKMLSQSLKKIQ